MSNERFKCGTLMMRIPNLSMSTDAWVGYPTLETSSRIFVEIIDDGRHQFNPVMIVDVQHDVEYADTYARVIWPSIGFVWVLLGIDGKDFHHRWKILAEIAE
jgi:hypothetical protein